MAMKTTPTKTVKKGPRVLITGGFGYLGARLALDLEKAGYQPILLTRDTDGLTGDAVVAFAKRFPIVLADITDRAALDAAFTRLVKGGPIDAVLHLAALNENICAKNPRLAFDVNAWGARNTIDASAKSGVRRFLYFSTFHVYGAVTDTVTESTVPVPLHPYGSSHLLGELLCREAARASGIELAIVRPTNGIGVPAFEAVDRWTLLALDLCRQAHEHGQLRLVSAGYQLRDFVSISDIAQAVRILLRSPASSLVDPVFNVGSGSCVRVRDVAKMVQLGYEKLYHKTLPITMPAGKDDGVRFTVSMRKIGDLGYTTKTDLEKELLETLRFCEVFRT
jgi:UDP-glucose 4-epimerase